MKLYVHLAPFNQAMVKILVLHARQDTIAVGENLSQTTVPPGIIAQIGNVLMSLNTPTTVTNKANRPTMRPDQRFCCQRRRHQHLF